MSPTFTPGRRFGAVFRYCWLWCLLLVGSAAQAQTFDAVVAKDGTGQFTTVQAAINAAPTGRTTPYTIFIRNGKYREKINVPANKPFLQFIGQSVANTILSWDDFSGKPMPGGGTFGTANSASVTINAPDFSALNVTFENTTGDAPQALAINVNADRAAFRNCRFLGGQDTVLTNASGNRQYFKNCYIDGTVDFIFGGAVAVFEHCVIYPKTRLDNASLSYITAANTAAGQTYGYVFRRCIIPPNRGTTTYVLGRPWQNATGSSPVANNKTVFLNTTMGAGVIRPEGWSTWDAGTNTSLITYAEFRSRRFNGALINTSQRVAWSRQLAVADTAAYARATVFGSWDPCAQFPTICPATPREIAATNFRAARGASSSTFTWNASWAIEQVKYELFRSATRSGTYTKLSEVIAANDSTYNFQLTDALPAAGSAFYYYLRASKTGLATHLTDTVEVSRVPTISTTGSLGAFAQYAGGPSAVRTYVLSGVNLTSSLTVTPPASYEISANGGTNWSTATTPLVLTPTNNALANTTISVRLNASAVGTFAGNITHVSTGAGTVSVPVTGSRTNAAAPVSVPLQWWPMTRNNQDSVAVRSARLAASTPTMRSLFVSNGTTVATIPPYSARYGQAFGASANGDGSWGTVAPVNGPGGNLNRRFYQQFTVTATGAAVRLDSLLLWSAFFNTNSNTRLAVVYSRTGFATDSTDVAGGIGPGGTLNGTANGAFATPIVLANQNTGLNQTYRLALTGASGVTLAAGQTLTFRLYYSCGSASPGRYAMLRDVVVKGEANVVTSVRKARSAALLTAYPNPADQALTLSHPRAERGASVTVLAFDGRQVAVFEVLAGAAQTPVSLQGLARGTYLLLYQSSTEVLTTKVVKQ